MYRGMRLQAAVAEAGVVVGDLSSELATRPLDASARLEQSKAACLQVGLRFTHRDCFNFTFLHCGALHGFQGKRGNAVH